MKKNRLLKDTDDYKRRQKLAQYAIRRGFEPALVWDSINNMFK